MKIVKVYRESMPNVKLIGKRYTDSDRDASGTYAGHWQQWFSQGWFDELSQCASAPNVSGDYIGAMRMTDENGGFEYWIGALCAPGAEVPDGFEAETIAACDLGVCWLYGDDKAGELYSMEASDMAMAALKEQGWGFSEKGWFFERYNHPRFTVPDEAGNVILDIFACLV